MRFDPTGFLPENLISMETMSVAGNATDGYIAFPQNIFYEHDFQLFETTQSDGTIQMERGVDYKLVFVVPGFRNRDTRYAAYAAVEIINKKPNATYRTSYRALGASMTVDIAETRRFFLDNDESTTDFFGLLINNAYVPDAERLIDPTLMASGVLIGYKSVIGAMEASARKLSAATQENGTSTGTADVADATATSKGILQLAGDLTGTSDRPRVVGLADKLDADEADNLYAKKTDVHVTINGQTAANFNLTAQDLSAYTSIQVDQLLDGIRQSITALQNVIVTSVNDQLPDEDGNVTIIIDDGQAGDGGNF